ncbi:MAG: flagellar biosynthesis protein FlhF [Lachnospiraceae bacterium]|nr:flagellar biosynthesis protein FlhF [Lachnospiraceae bacterium]
MIIKKFQGKTEAEATENAKKELGNGVVVMNVKNIKKRGLFSFFKPQLVEVTVALEDEAERFVAPKKETPHTGIAPVINRPVNVAPAVVQAEPEKDGKSVEVLEEKIDSLQNLLVAQLQKKEEPEEDKPIESKKEEAPAKDENIVRFMKLLYNIMLENEIDEKYINQIMDEIEKVHKPGMPFDYALANTYQKMILKFGKPSGITPATNGPKVVFYVGPTGVGKTTTIAKIASKFSVEDKKKVALLTADTYRIAAAEQLRTYANILEVPFRVIYTVEEIETALRDFKDFDYIFVDTAGHSHQNVAQKDNMNSFVHCLDGLVEKEVYLVVSATTKYRDLISIADSYKEMADFKLIFTKLDETTALGNILNLKLYTGADLSYVTCGQNVPDDIENFNPQKTVKQLLGGRK